MNTPLRRWCGCCIGLLIALAAAPPLAAEAATPAASLAYEPVTDARLLNAGKDSGWPKSQA